MSSSPAVSPPSEVPVKDPAAPAAMDSKSTNHNNDPQPSREDRRRLKKLRKRASRFFPTGDLSGMTKREEWEEVKNTRDVDDNDNNDKGEDFVPWVGMRQNKKQDRNKIRDGFDHRYTLKYLIHAGQQPTNSDNRNNANQNSKEEDNNSKKRKRSREEGGTSPSIPSWVCLHNPACVDHLAVIEVHVGGKELKPEELYNKLDSCLGAANAYATNWFDGPRPQSISDILLYEKPTQSSRAKAKPMDLSTEDGKKELLNTLKSFVLSAEEFEKEGYPLAEKKERTQNNPTTITMSQKFRKPESFSLEEAKALVEPTHAHVVDRDFPFVQTSSEKGNTEFPRILGVDCEMVKTDNGLELARITVIEYDPSDSFSYRVLMDDLVVPYPPVLDYVTEFSGITDAMLKSVSTRLEQVQAALLTYVRPTDILVGHSLENDLMALRWIHPTVIDTAVLFQTKGHFKYSLKHLSNVLLKKQIQGKADGHCSEEDAATTLELAVRRAQEGPTFSIQSSDKLFWIPAPTEKNPQVFVGPSPWLTKHVTSQPNGIHALTCDDVEHPNTKAIFSWLTGPRRRAGLVWANLELSSASHLHSLEMTLTELKAKLSTNTVLMVNVQEGHEVVAEEFKRRGTRRNAKATLPWTEEEEEIFRSALEGSRKGKVYWVTKHPGPAGATTK